MDMDRTTSHKIMIPILLENPIQIRGWSQQQLKYKIHKKLTLKIVSPYTTSPQHSMSRSITYKARALVTLISTQATPKHHVAMMAQKRRLNIFEAEIKMEMTAQTTPPGYALEITDE